MVQFVTDSCTCQQGAHLSVAELSLKNFVPDRIFPAKQFLHVRHNLFQHVGSHFFLN